MTHTTIRRLAVLALALLLLLSTAPALALDGVNYSYSYTYDYWAIQQETPDPYRVLTVLNSAKLGLDVPIKAPQSVFVSGSDIYLCDTGNNRILQIRRDGESFSLYRIIDAAIGDASPSTLSGPQDIYVNDKGEMFICDTGNSRVLKLDKDCNYLMSFVKPTDSTFDQSLAFLPTRVVSDTSGRAFVLSQNVNKGMIKFESNGQFTGYIGASEVKYDWYEYLWKLISTKEQRAQQESFVPTEYDNICIDHDGFIYAVTTTFATEELRSDQAKPIRKINSIGGDILVKNGEYPPIGDLDWGTAADISGPSRLVDITVLDNDIYIAVDRVRGRLFGYDRQGYLLWAFGGSGNIDGYFLNPISVEHMGYDLMVLDQRECSLTLFTPTEYGQLIYGASEDYTAGEYESSAEKWREVQRLNGNYELANVGIGRALLRQEQYYDAMQHFKLSRDTLNYAEAFRLYRKQWVEERIGWIIGVLFLALAIPLAKDRIRKIKEEVDAT